MQKHKDELNWRDVIRYQKHFSKKFKLKHSDKLTWDIITEDSTLHNLLTEDESRKILLKMFLSKWKGI